MISTFDEKENLETLMEEAYKISMNSRYALDVKVQAMEAYAKLMTIYHNIAHNN